MNKYDFKNLTPFKWCVIQNFPFIEEDFDAITNYQLLCKVVEYLNKTIINVNLLGNEYEKLNNYVVNYFDNLDVQDEINNKLDSMVEDGTLEQIINKFITETYLCSYNTINDMVFDDGLIVGNRCQTFGYYKIGDGGKGEYIIVDNEQDFDNGSVIRLNNGLYAKLVFPKDNLNIRLFGAKCDGINDDSIPINNAINYIVSLSNISDYSNRNTLDLTYGKIKINNPINLNTLVKIKTSGFVTIYNYSNIAIQLITNETEKDSGFERDNYLIGNIIDGTNGLRIINKNENTSIAIKMGTENSESGKYNVIARTRFKDININGFDIAILINPYDFYINTFDGLNLEQNKVSIQFGEDDYETYKNSGEKISFINCIFAGSDVVVKYLATRESIDLYFNSCSFDYNKCLFYSPNNNENTSAGRVISITNSHIEETSYNVSSVSTPHGILYGTFRAYMINISFSRILQTNLYNLFYSDKNTSYTLNLIGNDYLTYKSDVDWYNSDFPFMANDKISSINIISNESSVNTGILKRLSSFNNLESRGDWRYLESGAKFEIIKETGNGVIIGDFQQDFCNKINKDLVIDTITPLENGKSLRITVDTSNNWDSSTGNQPPSLYLISRERFCNAGDIFGIGGIFRNVTGSNLLVTRTYFYDKDGKEITNIRQTSPIPQNDNWSLISMPRFVKAPSGACSYKVRYQLELQTIDDTVDGTQIWVGGLFIDKQN